MVAAVADHVVAVAVVVANAAPPAALIIVLSIVGRMCATNIEADTNATAVCEVDNTRVGIKWEDRSLLPGGGGVVI